MKTTIHLLLAAVAIFIGHNAHGMLYIVPRTKIFQTTFEIKPEAVETAINTIKEFLKPETTKNAEWFAETLHAIVSLSWLRREYNHITEEFTPYWDQFFNALFPTPKSTQTIDYARKTIMDRTRQTGDIPKRNPEWFKETTLLLSTVTQDQRIAIYPVFNQIYTPDTAIQDPHKTLEDTLAWKISNIFSNIRNKSDYDNNKAYVFALLIELLRLNTSLSIQHYNQFAQLFFDNFINTYEPMLFQQSQPNIPHKITPGSNISLESKKKALKESLSHMKEISRTPALKEQVSRTLIMSINLAIIEQLKDDIAHNMVDIDNLSEQLITIYQDICFKIINASMNWKNV